MSNKIVFCKPSNKKIYEEFLCNKKINDSIFNDEQDLNIYFLIKSLLTPVGQPDILLDSNEEFDIDKMQWSNIYEGSKIDFVWTNSKENLNNVSFFKIFNKDLTSTDPKMFIEDIYGFIVEVSTLYQETGKYLSDKKNSNISVEKLDLIEQILQKLFDQNEKLKRNNDEWNVNQIEFNLYFYFPMSGEDEKTNEDDRKNISEKIEKIIQNYYKSNKILFKPEFIITEDDLKIGYELNLDNTLMIKEDKLSIDEENNFLYFDSFESSTIMKSYIFNISAMSLNKLWQKYENKLLGMNLRLHITNKNVDSELKNSITNQSDLFWFKNNGLTIICSDISFEGKKVTLKNFSIINGGQTTFNIGKSTFDKDFYLVCKVIVLKNLDFESECDFDTHQLCIDISLSTNNQKPIKKTDRISTISACRVLKHDIWNIENIFLEIRRGDRPFKFNGKKLEKWQKIKAETLQQIYYSFFLLKPGTARMKNEKIFKEEALKKSFEHMNNMLQFKSSKTIADLIKFWFILNKNVTKKEIDKLEKDNFDSEKSYLNYKKYFANFKMFSMSALFILKLMNSSEESKQYILSIKNKLIDINNSSKRKEDDVISKELCYLWDKLKINSIFAWQDVKKISDRWMRFLYKHMEKIFFDDIRTKENEEISSWTNFAKINVNVYFLIINIINNYDEIEPDLKNLFG